MIQNILINIDDRLCYIKGGGKEGDESPVETMNREFAEEIGTSLVFTEEKDFCFCYMEVNPGGINMTSIFCQKTSDLRQFTAILSNFHSGIT